MKSQKQTEHERCAGRRRSAGPIRATDRAAAGWTDWPSRRGPRRVPLKGWPPSQEERGALDSCVPTQRVAVRDPAPSLPPESQPPRRRRHTDRSENARYQKILLPTRRSGQVPLYSSAAKSDCMDYEEELDDNGVLRVRRVASPFVPIRDEREDEREAPRMAFDDDQMKAFRKTFDRYGETLFGHPIGSIPVAEMGTVLRSIGQNPTETELANLCEEVDKDKSGTIEFDEFVDLMARTNKTRDDMDKELVEAFQSFDVDGSGYLDREELVEALTTMGDGPVDEETVNEWIAEADADGDGKINLKEFISMMTNDDLGI